MTGLTTAPTVTIIVPIITVIVTVITVIVAIAVIVFAPQPASFVFAPDIAIMFVIVISERYGAKCERSGAGKPDAGQNSPFPHKNLLFRTFPSSKKLCRR